MQAMSFHGTTIITTVPRVAAVAAILGVVSHLVYFIHGEHHRYAHRVALAFLGSPIILLLYLSTFGNFTIWYGLYLTTIIWWSFTGALWASMLIYRAYFHRLHQYPGPFMAKLSKIWHAWDASHSDGYKRLNVLHQKYGEYVRIGTVSVLLFLMHRRE
jgi:hypothetical protein